MISQARMDELFVVEAIDVSGDRGVEFGIACEAALVGEFSLQGMEETFHVGVVLAIARPVHAGYDAARAQEVLIAIGGVLDTAIGVKEQPGPGTAKCDCPFQSTQGHIGCTVAGQSPADDAPREEIHDRGEIAPLLTQAQVREIISVKARAVLSYDNNAHPRICRGSSGARCSPWWTKPLTAKSG